MASDTDFQNASAAYIFISIMLGRTWVGIEPEHFFFLSLSSFFYYYLYVLILSVAG